MSDQYNDEKQMPRMADRTNRKVFFKKRKGCPLCEANAPEVSYKNPDALRPFTSENGRILPRRITNVCAKHQRSVTSTIKFARILALLPFTFTI